jgi:tetratricopeptide (TPR) repeat protein
MLLVSGQFLNRASRLVSEAELVAPDSPDVLIAKFRLLMRFGRYSEGLATFRHLLDVDSSSAGIAAEFVECDQCWRPVQDAVPLLERTARLNPLAPNREVIYATLGRMLIMLGRDEDAIAWLEQANHIVQEKLPSQLAARDSNDYSVENIKVFLAAAYAHTGRLDEAHSLVASAMPSDRAMDFTVRWFLNQIPAYYSAEQRAQEERLAEGFRLAGVREHLDESADFHIRSDGLLHDRPDGPTPLDLPGATTIDTAGMQRLLLTTPNLLVLTTTPFNPSIPGAILVSGPAGKLDDDWQTELGTLIQRATNGQKDRPIVTFSYSINHWYARNLAVRLLALGYTQVFWYRGGWEAWDARRLPKMPLTVRFAPSAQTSTQPVSPSSR